MPEAKVSVTDCRAKHGRLWWALAFVVMTVAPCIGWTLRGVAGVSTEFRAHEAGQKVQTETMTETLGRIEKKVDRTDERLLEWLRENRLGG